MKNHFIVAAIVAVSIIIAFNMGLKKGNTNCVNSADVLHTDTMPLSIYLSTNDIAHVYFADKKIYFENGGEPIQFKTNTELYSYIEDMTAYTSSIIGYKQDFDLNVHNGYIFAKTIYNDDEQYTELHYNGPNWTISAEQDTSYLITTFNHVEKIYNPKTRTFEYDHYTVD